MIFLGINGGDRQLLSPAGLGEQELLEDDIGLLGQHIIVKSVGVCNGHSNLMGKPTKKNSPLQGAVAGAGEVTDMHKLHGRFDIRNNLFGCSIIQ